MTTIAFDGKTIASDSLLIDQFGLKSYVKKIHFLSDCLIAGAGDFAQITQYIRQTRGKSYKDIIDDGYLPYKRDDNDPSLMLITEDLDVYCQHGGQFVEINASQWAIGSGRDFAIAAMHLGKSAYAAVEIAKIFDSGTGGDVHSFNLTEDE